MNNPFEQLSTKLDIIEQLLLEIKHGEINLPSLGSNNDPLTIEQAAERLHLTRATLYNKVAHNEIPFSKKGKRLYFLPSELDEWIQTGRKKTDAELGKEVKNLFNQKR